MLYVSTFTLLEKKVQLGEPSGEKGSQKGSLHVQEPKKVPYITKNDSKESKKVLKIVLQAHSEPFREPLKVPLVGQPENLFSKSVIFNQQVVQIIYFSPHACRIKWLQLNEML